MNNKNIILFVLILLVSSCKTGNEIAYTNLSSIYHPRADLQISGIRVFNENDSISRVFLQYSTAGLKYEKPVGTNYFKANYQLSFQLFASYESSEAIDSQDFVLSDSLFYQTQAVLAIDFPVKANYPGSYLLQIRFTDLNTDEYTLYPKLIYKNAANNSQNFLPLDDSGNVVYENWISWKNKFRIKCSNTELSKLYVNYYNREFPAAAPPFSQAHPQSYNYEPDETFEINVKGGLSEPLQYAREGYFHFQAETTDQQGITIYRFHDDFPEVKTPEQLIPPLRYLTTNKEYQDLMNAPDAKFAVDKFWTNKAGNEERAVELIKKYYARVEQANLHFSSYKEGWKTDRGMFYIIFGEPTTVYRRTDIETWVYGEQGNRVFLTFDFIRAINPFSDDDYELQRQPDFKQQWYNAVLFWRQ